MTNEMLAGNNFESNDLDRGLRPRNHRRFIWEGAEHRKSGFVD